MMDLPRRESTNLLSARRPWTTGLAVVAGALALTACSSNKPKPAELGPNVVQLGVSQAWTAQIGKVAFPLAPRVVGDTVVLASSQGDVVRLDGATGRELSRAKLNATLVAGVGSDGERSAVVTDANQLVLLEGGQEKWRRKLAARTYTAPLVAGGRVFVLAGDRSVTAYDGATGQSLWGQSRQEEPLVLRQAGLITAVGDTLVVGQGGRLAGMNPGDGRLLWEAPIATPRGANDIERLADLVAPFSREGDEICARAFQAAVGCVSASTGQMRWSKPANGGVGVGGDAERVFGVEANGRLQAWNRANGESAWRSDRLMYRVLSAPLVLGRSVVVGDNAGTVHLLSREDGSPLNRLSTDGSAISTAPVAVGNTLVVVTSKGGVYGFRPQ